MAFDLSSISPTKRKRAFTMSIYGPGKIGKTTFAACAPSPIGILTEDGMSAIDGLAFPICQTLEDVYSAINFLLKEDHQFKTVFLDSLDWLEPLIYADVCQQNNWKDIESPGYGKGYTVAAEAWRVLLTWLTALRANRDMNVILIGHEKITRFEDPMREGYDVYGLKLHQRASALVQEWSDVIAFANYQVFTKTKDVGFNKKQVKAIGGENRLLHLEARPSFVAGNRFNLPPELPLTWADFEAALTASMA